uniref:Uncharacterized protein n=1 Tax=Arundo donax TaxID=35708 RepID=A0A0A9BAD9_ARUDO
MASSINSRTFWSWPRLATGLPRRSKISRSKLRRWGTGIKDTGVTRLS